MKMRLIILSLLATAIAGNATVRLPAVLSDGVILQRNQPVRIWGTASPGETVNVKIGKQKGSTVADNAGNWLVTLKPFKAGGPYTLTANDVTVTDVLFGDLYLGSGQSNMELPVSRTLDFYADEVANYNNGNIREFKTPKEYAFHGPQKDVKATPWKKAIPEDAKQFGALVYFMAKDLYEHNGHVPVGIVNSSWGGSKIQTWLSEEALQDYPVLLNSLRMVEDDEYRASLSKAQQRGQSLWYGVANNRESGNTGTLRWNAPALDDSDWQEYDLLSTEWGKRPDGSAINGIHWLRRHFNLPASQAGKPAELRLGCIVDADSVFINGKFVGWTAYQYPPRIYKVPEGLLKEKDNVIAIRVQSNYGAPHVVSDKPHKLIFDDKSEYSLEGAWKHRIGIEMPSTPGANDWFQTPSVLYNGMIAPMLHLPFRGVVWYQGESDIDIRNQYKGLMKSLVKDWRKQFDDPDMPFYIVELADFLHESDVNGRKAWQEMRDAQRLAADETPRVYFIQNGDIGEWNDIHPRDKKTPGTRVSAAIQATPAPR